MASERATTLKLQLKSRRIVPSKPRLDVGMLRDETIIEEFANSLSVDLGIWVFWGHLKSCGVLSRVLSMILPVYALELTGG